MSTLEIAELTGKRHADVLRDADKMLGQLGIGERNFASSYVTEQNKIVRLLNLPKRETLILVSGYSVELRARIIDRWQELEEGLREGWRRQETVRPASRPASRLTDPEWLRSELSIYTEKVIAKAPRDPKEPLRKLGVSNLCSLSSPERLRLTEANLTKRFIPLALGVAMASAMSPAFAADLAVAPPPAAVVFDPVAPVVAVVTLPIKVATAIVDTLAPPPAPVVAKY